MGKIRPLALALLRHKNKILLSEGFDSVKHEKFYRPLGGGIEFGEKGHETVARELKEEINLGVHVGKFVGVFENIFTYEGKSGHEIVLVFESEIAKSEDYKERYSIIENGKICGSAVWLTANELKNSAVYPAGILEFV